MTDTKFTPGPWKFDRHIWWENTPGEQEKHGALIVWPAADEDLTIAEVNDFFDKKIGRANAHLIAAAPDLYELLVRLRSTYRDDDPAAREIDAHLAKARGETE